MAGNKKPRKAYVAKAINPAGGLGVVADREARRKPLDPEKQTETLVAYYTSIDAFLMGRATQDHFNKLCYAANITCVLGEWGFGGEHDEMIQQGMAAVWKIKERQKRTKRWGIDGDACQALYAMEDLHRAQLEAATKGDIEAAIIEFKRRLRAGNEFRMEKAA